MAPMKYLNIQTTGGNGSEPIPDQTMGPESLAGRDFGGSPSGASFRHMGPGSGLVPPIMGGPLAVDEEERRRRLNMMMMMRGAGVGRGGFLGGIGGMMPVAGVNRGGFLGGIGGMMPGYRPQGPMNSGLIGAMTRMPF